MIIEPDTKDWTWVLERPCDDCGYDAAAVDDHRIGDSITATVTGYLAALSDEDCAVRPAPHVWSPLEYSCHVRDVHQVFGRRLQLMLTQDDPVFDNWDQDAAAVTAKYDLADPSQVGPQLVAAATRVARQYAAVPEEAWQRRGRRSNGSVFTVSTLGRYHLHDVVHHLHDVRS